MANWILESIGPDVPVHFTAFHPDFRMLDREPTSHETLIVARGIALEEGLNYVYVGNVHDVDRQSTYCPKCRSRIIERDWYELSQFRVSNGRCANCDQLIPGRFENRPGTWGRKRQPIRIGASIQ